MSKIMGWLWNWLPDKCEVDGCSRKGVRGNEMCFNGVIMCDYCHARWTRQAERGRADR